MISDSNRLITQDGTQLAYHRIAGKTPGVVFLGGFNSDMTGTKATFLEAVCQKKGHAFIRFDYFAHGASSGKFISASFTRWKKDVLEILDNLTTGPQILVGSSMGGWLMMLAAQERKERIHGIMGIASAPDFMEDLVYAKLSDLQKKELETAGICYVGEKAHPLTSDMLEDARKHKILHQPIDLFCPIRLIHGLNDAEVPWHYSEKLLQSCSSEDITLTLIKGGDHRLSRPNDLSILEQILKELIHYS